jgi:hypothetical protein
VLDYATEKLFKPLGIDTRNAYTARFRPDDPTPFEIAAPDGPPTPKRSTSVAATCGSDPPTGSSLDSSTLTTASGMANS